MYPLRPRSRSPFHLALPLATAVTAAAVFLSPGEAAAYDVLAEPCADEPLTCKTGRLHFEKINALPIEFNFDTGWVPQGSPLQVHLWAAVYANTAVSLRGALDTAWPEVFHLTAPGTRAGSAFSYHYGLDVGAQGAINISVLGQTFTWVGNLPYVPQIDFAVQADTTFDGWGWDPGVGLSSTTNPVRLAKVSIGSIVGGSIPGIDGGFELDVAMEVASRYQTHSIVVAEADGPTVAGGELTYDGDATSTTYPGGPAIELDVHPEGTVKYDGTLHLIPAFYVELLGQTWSIPIVDIPIGFPITEDDWIFDTKRVRVPLPDLVLSETEINFGNVEVGQKNLEPFPLYNAGEALVAATVVTDDPTNFEVFDPTVQIEPGITVDSAVRFVPKKNGEFVAKVLVGSNDPDAPLQIVTVRGVGYGGPEDEVVGGVDVPAIAEDAGCDCRTAGGGSEGRREGGLAAVAGLALLAARRRRVR
ncbi:MYXO-CTERM sorting domain-containing protein [Chondromyces crocatus]|uniref:HYDIN/VesB/CFA65-like Ig-like domain-containing protein n=1 Tax=Chondromyces crocatus TaxID=52 RepID=A0A0K1E961_CHOCO|nr:MYXO-CTERM sorting domain-containing protein [Chondromyces crocatus]AKT37421.1 uncharacterized protein CMC5_015620 [Chondromyces crocatus]